jgi:hypothetical protein
MDRKKQRDKKLAAHKRALLTERGGAPATASGVMQKKIQEDHDAAVASAPKPAPGGSQKKKKSLYDQAKGR